MGINYRACNDDLQGMSDQAEERASAKALRKKMDFVINEK
jgi:hypothetical protein